MNKDLDMFVLFSSAAGIMGNPGQTNHASANTFLDQLAAHRRALGLPGQAIAWGAWSEIGEAAEQRERIEERLDAGGTGWMTPQQGLQAFEKSGASGRYGIHSGCNRLAEVCGETGRRCALPG